MGMIDSAMNIPFQFSQSHALIALGILVFCIYSIYKFQEEKKLRIPGLWASKLPVLGSIIGITLYLVRYKKMAYDFLVLNNSKYGLVWGAPAVSGNRRTIVASDPDCVQYILQTNFNNFLKGQEFQWRMFPFFGNGIFNSDGSAWKQQRQVASHLFKVKELREMVNVFNHHTSTLVTILNNRVGTVVDFQDLFARLTLDSIGEIAFGYNINSLSFQEVPFAKAFNTVQICISERFANPINVLLGPLRSFMPSERELARALKVIDSLAYEIIDKRINDPELFQRTDLLSKYIVMQLNEQQSPQMNNQNLDKKYLRDIVMNYMIAGRDTTAVTLTFATYLLSHHPRVVEKILKEINEELHGQPPDYDNVKKMTYLTAVIDETLRLYPPVSFDPKEAAEDDELPNGTKVPKGSFVVWTAYGMGRSDVLWENPFEFIPERWIDPVTYNGGKQIGAFHAIPFQAGPRTCLGKNMVCFADVRGSFMYKAYLELKIVLITLVQQFKFEYVMNHPPQLVPSVTIYAKGGVCMKVHKS